MLTRPSLALHFGWNLPIRRHEFTSAAQPAQHCRNDQLMMLFAAIHECSFEVYRSYGAPTIDAVVRFGLGSHGSVARRVSPMMRFERRFGSTPFAGDDIYRSS
jgi:hypothetical protein